MTGWLLKSNELTCGIDALGQLEPGRRARSTASMVSLRSVPKSNWAKTSESEFDDVDCIVSSRGTLARARSMGSVTWLATSSAPAPGQRA